MGSFGTLHSRRSVADAILVHELHLVPRIFCQLFHIIDYLYLTVKHQQRVIEVGNAGYDVTLHHRLIVLTGDELHLCRPLSIQQVAKKIDVPRGAERHLVGLRRHRGVCLQRSNGSLRCERHGGQEGQPGHLQALVHHLHVQGSIQKVGILLQPLLNELLQLWVSEQLSPRQIAKRRRVCGQECPRLGYRVADDAVSHDLWPVVFVVKAATHQEQAEKAYPHPSPREGFVISHTAKYSF